MRDRADADAVNALVRELTGLRASEFLDSPPPLASVGLDPPRATLTVELPRERRSSCSGAIANQEPRRATPRWAIWS